MWNKQTRFSFISFVFSYMPLWHLNFYSPTIVSYLSGSLVDAMYKTRLKMERIYRDGLDPYKHPTYCRVVHFM